MDYRVVPPAERPPNKYDKEVTFEIPAKVVAIYEDNARGALVPIVIERLDFYSGKIVKTKGITFKKSLGLLKDLKGAPPYETRAIVYKSANTIHFKVIGAYNTGVLEDWYQVDSKILDNDDDQIMPVYESNYRKLRDWVGKLPTNTFDI